MSGTQVSQLAAFSAQTGNWSKLDLEMRDQPAVAIPVVGDKVACIQLKGKIAAYSPVKDRWDVLTTEAPPQVAEDFIIVDGKDFLAVFSVHTGSWASLPKE